MQVTLIPEPSVAGTARRAQIADATIAVIAAEGFAQASYARIAKQAGLSSTRLISYHFTNKDELILGVVQQVITMIGEAVGQAVGRASSSRDALRAYIEAVVAFTDSHRAEMRALLQIVLAGALSPGTRADDVVPDHLEALLRNGQASGELRQFDARVMAMAIQRSVESLPFALESDPGLDCPAFARELVTLFDLATRREAW